MVAMSCQDFSLKTIRDGFVFTFDKLGHNYKRQVGHSNKACAMGHAAGVIIANQYYVQLRML